MISCYLTGLHTSKTPGTVLCTLGFVPVWPVTESFTFLSLKSVSEVEISDADWINEGSLQENAATPPADDKWDGYLTSDRRNQRDSFPAAIKLKEPNWTVLVRGYWTAMTWGGGIQSRAQHVSSVARSWRGRPAGMWLHIMSLKKWNVTHEECWEPGVQEERLPQAALLKVFVVPELQRRTSFVGAE